MIPVEKTLMSAISLLDPAQVRHKSLILMKVPCSDLNPFNVRSIFQNSENFPFFLNEVIKILSLGLQKTDDSGKRAVALEQQLRDAAATCHQYEREAEDVRSEIRELQRQVERGMLDKSALEERLESERKAKENVEYGLAETERLAKSNVRLLKTIICNDCRWHLSILESSS